MLFDASPFALTIPFFTCSCSAGVPSLPEAISSSRYRAVAAALRSGLAPAEIDVLPPTPPWSGVAAVSPMVSLMRPGATSSSSATT